MSEGRKAGSHAAPSLANLLASANMSQSSFAALGGWLPSTVNRWCRQRETDARSVPRDALALALFCRVVSPEARQAIGLALDAMEHTKEDTRP